MSPRADFEDFKPQATPWCVLSLFPAVSQFCHLGKLGFDLLASQIECSSLPFYVLISAPYLSESPLSHPGLSEWSFWFCAIPLALSRSPFRWGHFSSSSSLSSRLDFSSFIDAPCGHTPIHTVLSFFLLQTWMALAFYFQHGASHQFLRVCVLFCPVFVSSLRPSSWNVAPWLLEGTTFLW